LFHIRQHVEAIPSSIKDTTDYLQKMAALNPLPSNTTLVNMDVTSLYTNIPHSNGIEALFFLSAIVRIVTKQSEDDILTERDSQISLQASMPLE
jgi:hypothetical protein